MRKFTADFETTTDAEDCRVWAYALSEIGNPSNFIYGNSMDDFMEWCGDRCHNFELYFHNLKFDGCYIISWLLSHGFTWIEDKKDRDDLTFTTLITDMGQFYSIVIYFEAHNKKHVNKITIKDSLKILNFSVERIAQDFNLPIRKLSIDYKAYRPIGHKLTDEEVDYIRNDVEIMSMALETMFEEGLTKMTIASDALTDFKSRVINFRHFFPELPLEIDQDIRRSYKGGFTYLNPIYQGIEMGAGYVLDKNSMYPSKMVNELLPVGWPIFFEGRYIKDRYNPLYIQRLTCSFKLKKGKIPSIQLKNSPSFKPNEYIESSNGELVTLTLCNPDLELFLENYDIDEVYWQGGWKFRGVRGIFKNYVEYWTEKKIEAKKNHNGAKYVISKLMLNSLYGRFGLNPMSRTKRPFLVDGVLKFGLNEIEQRKPIYVAMASFITAYARKDIIESAQKIRNYGLEHYGYDPWCYCDTDSLHVFLKLKDLNALKRDLDIDDYKLGAWKIESQFTRAKFLRQKCYIEENEGTLNVTIAGLPKRLGKYINFDNFEIGFTTEGMQIDEHKLSYKQVKGGVLLVDTDFTIK